MKNAFYYTEKAHFVLQILKFLYFLSFSPQSVVVEFTGEIDMR